MQVDITPTVESQRVWREDLDCGSLHLEIRTEHVPLGDLVGFASRVNPARRYSFVSRVIGKHIPTRPQRLREIASKLAGRIPDLDGPVMFIGLAEMGVTLGQAVFDAWQERTGATALYIDSTRVALGNSESIPFSEEHSHASSHRLHIPAGGDRGKVFNSAPSIVLVDDEVTTGRTAKNLIRAITATRGFAPETVVVASALSWASSNQFHDVSLANGEMTYMPKGLQEVEVPDPESSDWITIPANSGGSRAGLLVPEKLPEGLSLDVVSDGKYLVVGTGEFGFLPLRFAESIESRGGHAYLQSTSRSPLYVGNAIHHRREFPSLGGGTWREFLYNVPDAHGYDDVFLCVEESDRIPQGHPLREIPGLQIVTLPR